MKNRKLELVATGALLLAALLSAGACSAEKQVQAANDSGGTATVAVARVERASLAQSIRVAAEFRPFQEIDVHAKVAGYVKHIYVDVGSRVRQGQVLADLEVPELHDELDQVAAASRRAEQQVAQARDELRRAQANQTVAHLAYTRLQNVMKTRPELVAQQDVDDAQGRDEAAQAQVAAAQSGLAAAQEMLNEASANRSRVQALLNYTRIAAPFDGVVTARYADTGAMLAAGTSSEKQALSLVKLSENGLLRLDIPVPEEDVPLVHLGKKVSVEVQSLRRSFGGTVARFADTVDPSTRTMMTEVDVPNPQLEIVPGMYAYVSFPVQEKKNALAVPVQAITRESGKAVAYRINRDNRIEILPVTLGLQTGSRQEILSGLSEGDEVVVANTSRLAEGERVVPKPVELSEIGGGS
ncbi:MAG TPA: efflux RND transporter periplasmic adaptor subunit [Bryobacteraceae bacterium]|nr:efflux RND transporter periplasmic adaptor subunit [Bryobacteraceae bacterium]